MHKQAITRTQKQEATSNILKMEEHEAAVCLVNMSITQSQVGYANFSFI